MGRRVAIVVSSLSLCLGLAGCLWFGMATVGGTLTGLPTGTSVILQNNGKDNLTLTQNGRFTFNNTLDDGDDYNVTVLTNPSGATCTPSNNTGKINSKGDDVENVLITCAATGNLTGTISGLPASAFVTVLSGVTGVAPLPVLANGSFTFPGTRANGTNYAITVQTPLPNGIGACDVTGGTGQIASGVPNAPISIACHP
jgi:hypothetical protein